MRTEAATLRELSRMVHAVGRVEANERLTYTISPKFEGWIERLHVNTTGAQVKRGQPLLEVYSPELVSAQREYAIAVQGQQALAKASPEARAGMKQLADASLARMKNWDISAEQLKALSQNPEARHTLTYRSPASGIVMEKKVVQGMRFMPGDVLYQITDLSSVWVLADVFEQDMAMVRSEQTARVRFNAYPGKEFEARLTYVYPTLNAQTRTVPVRLEMANPGMLLKPAMYADIELSVPSKGKVLTIPTSAVIYGGKRPERAGGTGRRPLRTARHSARQSGQRLCRSAGRAGRGRKGSGFRQLPDRLGEQSQGRFQQPGEQAAPSPPVASDEQK